MSTKPTAGVSGSALLKELVDSATTLPRASSDLGTIQLNLSELKKKAANLRHNKSDVATSDYKKAHYLLAGSGFVAEELESELTKMDSHAKLETGGQIGGLYGIGAVNGGDLDGYLRAKKDENILSAIEQSLVGASRDFDNFVSQNISMDWKQRKEEIRESFGIILKKSKRVGGGVVGGSGRYGGDTTQRYGFNTTNATTPHHNTTSTRPPSTTRQMSREKFEIHAQLVYQLNDSRLDRKYFAIASTFAEINKLGTDIKSKQLYDSWKILANLVEEGNNKVYEEGKYRGGQKNGEELAQLNRRMVDKSRNYLEKQFLDYVGEVYRGESLHASATNTTKITTFINKKKTGHKLKQQTLHVNGVPIWAVLFYLLRAGCLKEALELTMENSQVFQKYEKSFPMYLRNYVESGGSRRLNGELAKRLHNEFHQYFAGTMASDNDPYRYAVYKIIGRCDLTKKSLPASINLSIEDWLWFHLSLVKEDAVDDTAVFERYTLGDLQKTVLGHGAARFNGSNNNPFYLKALMFVGLFDVAVEYVVRELNECDGVHLAVGLAYYGLLSGSNVDYSRLLENYTATFRVSDPKIAAQYLILICVGDSQLASVSQEMLRMLLLETREFSMLLGSITSDGIRIPGVLEQRKSLIALESQEQYLRAIPEQTAQRAEEEGRVFDSILLYQMAEEYDTVVLKLNKLLGELLSVIELDKPLVDARNDTVESNVVLLAQQLVLKTFNNNGDILKRIQPRHRETCNVLLKMVEVRELFLKQSFDNCISEISKLGLLPVNWDGGSGDDTILVAKRMAEEFQNYDDSVSRNIPGLLIVTMTSIAQLVYELSQSEFEIGLKGEKLAKLRGMGRNCMIFAGMVQYRMPRETYSLLISLEGMM